MCPLDDVEVSDDTIADVSKRWNTRAAATAPAKGDEPVDFPYQQTFKAIAAAVEIYPSKEQALGLSISVKKFQDAFNAHPSSDRPAKGDEPVAWRCEHCDNAFDIEHMTMSGDVWLCPACVLAWDETFAACEHKWEPDAHEGVAGQYCSKCSGFVEDADFAAMPTSVGGSHK